MQRAVSIRKLPLNNETGFTLIELLVSLSISGIMLAIMVGFVRANVGTRFDMNLRSEAAQGLRSLQSMLSQEIRQAGACLPTSGPFVALEGVDSGTLDTLTVRIGQTSTTTSRCISANLTADATQNSTTVALASTSDFKIGGRVYITNQSNGNLNTILSKTATTLTLTSGLNVAYASGATTVYPIDERTYKVMTGPLGRPALQVAIDGGSFQPLIDGVEKFRVQYWTGPCLPSCTVVDFPATSADWYRVAEISIDATVRGHMDNSRAGQVVNENGVVTVKPRNLYLQ